MKIKACTSILGINFMISKTLTEIQILLLFAIIRNIFPYPVAKLSTQKKELQINIATLSFLWGVLDSNQ